MPFGWSKTRYSPIAVDFGADSLKLLQIVPCDPPQLVAAACAEIPDGVRNDPPARHAFYGEALKSMLKLQPFKGHRAICSIPAYQTLAQTFEIARVDQEDFQTQIELQLRQRLNIDPSRMVIRNFEITQVVRDGVNKHEVLCLAASRDAVMKHLQSAERAKLDVIGLQCEPLAIVKAFGHLYRGAEGRERTTCFIDIGAATTKVVISHGETMVFAKTIHAAGDHFTRHVAKSLEMSFSEARRARMAAYNTDGSATPAAAEPVAAPTSTGSGSGMAALDARIAAEQRRSDSSTGAASRPQPISDDTADNETMDCLVDELQLCVRYHQSLFPGRQIEKLVFCGGEARNTALCQRIARAMHIGAQLGDPLARLLRINQSKPAMGVDIHRPQPGWAVPMGLCLSEGSL
ncbi:MAG: pilus assembly protein PilM [Planctomycetes bacterium]|nr:pilus assembly protein PilM [Planctomycetota bacterium]